MEPTEFNRIAWDNIATSSKKWFEPVSGDVIARARDREFQIRLTGCKPIPDDWVGDVTDREVLCLAAGGGHQGPVLAAAGAKVTVVDFSEKQLAIDRKLAAEHSLPIETVVADLVDLEPLDSERFDLIVNPCSVNFCPDVRRVWEEAARVLKPGGVLLTGLIQPTNYLFDQAKLERGEFEVRFRIPYSDLDLPEDLREVTLGPERPIEFGHTLTDLIGGQLDSGLVITSFMEDRWGGEDPLSDRIATFIATRAIKLRP